jgi:polysaccharide biosynthesis/export protein
MAKILKFLVFFLAWAGLVFASEGAYLIGAGDVLLIKVYGDSGLSKEYEVGNDGAIRMPWIREVMVTGKTARQVEAQLEQILGKDYLVNPQIAVTVKEYKSKKIYILGAVKNPGHYSLRGSTRILEALAMAGGIAPGGGQDFRLIRGGDAISGKDVGQWMSEKSSKGTLTATGNVDGAKVMAVDGHKLLEKGDLSQNVLLRGGDILFVNKTASVYFDGEVKKPGSIPFEEGLTMMRAISLAGGLTQNASKKVIVTRTLEGKNQRIVVSLKKISDDPNENFFLAPGDVVTVKRSLF